MALAAVQPDMTVEDVQELLERTEKGQVKNTVRNAETILSYDPFLRGCIRYNEMSQQMDLVKDMGWNRKGDGSSITDDDMYNIHLYFSRIYGFNSLALIDEAAHIVSRRTSYHPIRELLTSLEWDGKERIRNAMKHFLGAEASDYSYGILRQFMLGAACRVFSPGVKFDLMLCVVGDQGAGKSSFFRLLALRDEWFTDDLKDLSKDDVYEKLQGHWIIEMSEMLAQRTAKNDEATKAFLSRNRDSYRTRYNKYAKDRPRQCVFAGTTNRLHFLPNDRTGNRRFMPISCTETEAEVFILDNEKESREYIRQMWAELMEIMRTSDYSLKLPKELEKEVVRRQSMYMQEDADAGSILGYLEQYTGDKVCSKQLYKEALGHEYDQPTRRDLVEINEIMTQLIRNGTLKGWRRFDTPRRFGRPYGTQKGWERIPVDPETPSTEGEFTRVEPEDRNPFEQLSLPILQENRSG